MSTAHNGDDVAIGPNRKGDDLADPGGDLADGGAGPDRGG